ncbi:MAG: TonB-dependent receptor [Pseudomonadota bacterium]|nr:TonB-dependent receptor [Pseudomonadota bacterium]
MTFAAFNDRRWRAMTNDKTGVRADVRRHSSCARQSAVICHALLLSLCAAAPGVWAQDAATYEVDDDGALAPVVVRGSRAGADRWQSPASMDVVSADDLKAARPQIGLAESLGRVPGLVVRDRQNFAQDAQLSVRGFGSRASFGVRGLKLYVDGIPASAPDGQGQTSHFPLSAAERIEVVRGPFAALYGASSGGVLMLTTEDGRWPGEWRAGFAAGSDGLWRLSTQALGRTAPPDQPGWAYALSASGFATDGARPHSAAAQGTANLKLTRQSGDDRLVLLFNTHALRADDPLGLSRTEFDANPRQTTPNALRYDTRKTVRQTQLGAAWEHHLNAEQRLELMGWLGQRGVWQYQAIPPAAQAAPLSAGGVIDLGRAYGGAHARWRLDRPVGDATLGLVAGLSWGRQREQRRGHENFIGDQLGVLGRLRRNETNTADAAEPYVQAEWRTPGWTLAGGLRYSNVRFNSRDHYIAPGNGDDSGRVRYSGLSPVVGARVQLAESLQAFASVGGGFETPTLNEAAYSPGGQAGLNRALSASRQQSAELGLRGRHGWGGWSAALFDVRTRNEIVPALNQGGRATFQNAGRTRRHGLELSLDAELGTFTLTGAATFLQARFRDGYSKCAAPPCAPADVVVAGQRIPGIARQQLYAQIDWRPAWAQGAVLGLQARHTGRVPVNDANSDFASAATVLALSLRHDIARGTWRLQPFVRIDNLTNRRYAGSVIVNEANGRFFEPAAGRSVFVGLDVRARR